MHPAIEEAIARDKVLVALLEWALLAEKQGLTTPTARLNKDVVANVRRMTEEWEQKALALSATAETQRQREADATYMGELRKTIDGHWKGAMTHGLHPLHTKVSDLRRG